MTVFNIESVRPVSFCLFLSRSLFSYYVDEHLYSFLYLSLHTILFDWYIWIISISIYLYIFIIYISNRAWSIICIRGSLTSRSIFIFHPNNFFFQESTDIPWWLTYVWVDIPFIFFFRLFTIVHFFTTKPTCLWFRKQVLIFDLILSVGNKNNSDPSAEPSFPSQQQSSIFIFTRFFFNVFIMIIITDTVYLPLLYIIFSSFWFSRLNVESGRVDSVRYLSLLLLYKSIFFFYTFDIYYVKTYRPFYFRFFFSQFESDEFSVIGFRFVRTCFRLIFITLFTKHC